MDNEARFVVRLPLVSGQAELERQQRTPYSKRFIDAGQKTGSFRRISDVDQIERVYAFRSVDKAPLHILIGLPVEDFEREWRSEVLKTVLLGAAFAAVVGELTWLVYRGLRKQANSLEDLHLMNKALSAQKHLNAAIVKSSPLAIYVRDKNGLVTTWNAAAEKLFGWPAEEIIGKPLLATLPDKQREIETLRALVLSGESILEQEVQRPKRDGTLVDLSSTQAPLRDEQGLVSGYLTIAADITQRKEAEKKIEFLAYRDVLTSLPNRLLLQDRFKQALSQAERSGQKLALLFLDLDNFKTINDSLGHAIGDSLLKMVAQRLQTCVRESDTISRQGGDEFLILLPEVSSGEAMTPLLTKICEQLHAPYAIDGHELSTSVSIGVATFPQDGREFDVLLKKADTAMYRAKAAGRNGYRFFDEQMNIEAVEHLNLKNGLRHAIARDEFVLHYQPLMDTASRTVVGAEALIRWNHPEQGLVAPGRFIALAEETGLIVPMGEWVLHQACRQAAAWRSEGLPPLVMAVNLSAVQFKRSDVEKSVKDALLASGFDPQYLELELTESILVHNSDQVLATVQRLKALGVKLSIDDFGTGYSSLSYLKRFDVDKLKIDQSFTRDLMNDRDDAAIVRAIVQMARSLELKTIAEGVETAESLEWLSVLGCSQVQGYYFAKPMPPLEFVEYLRAHLPPV